MPYIMREVRAGDVMEKKKYHSARYGGKSKRMKNWRETPEKMKRINRKRAQEHLRWLILANFHKDDWRLDLTYANPEPPTEEAIKRLRAFIRALRRVYRNHGEELKYIYTTERKGHRIHHHLLINNVAGISREEIAQCWPWAKLNYQSMHFYDGGIDDAGRIATYFIKETDETIRDEDSPQKWRCVPSRNLEKPKITREVIHARTWRENPKPPKGYELESVWNGYTDDGYPCQTVRYRKIPDDNPTGGNRRQRRARARAEKRRRRSV